MGRQSRLHYNSSMAPHETPWPEFPTSFLPDTHATLHMWLQIVGKIRLALAPPLNHWWGVALYLTARGLTTSPMPYSGDTFEITFDFIAHQLIIETSDGRTRTVALVPQTVADFYSQTMRALADLRIDVRIWPMPAEVPSPIRFDLDRQHASYDPDAVQAWWRVQLRIADVMNEFRARFIGKSSPVHFWWGGFDLAATRFNGRRAPARPNADAITREGYSHEVISAGFWPGTGAIPPSFYAYAAPEPDGFKAAKVQPAEAFYSQDLNEFLLAYDDVRKAASPRQALLDFLQSTYDAGATLGRWNRGELER
jgi:hypothetical protein